VRGRRLVAGREKYGCRVDVAYLERASLDNDELQALFVRAWAGNGKVGYDAVLARSFTWISAHHGARLIGFVNVAWDGGVHFFLLDTTVDPDYRHGGVGSRLVVSAVDACRGHGEWVHVDAGAELMERLYVPAGFGPAHAGTIDVRN
jgi:GNAT superfamily N-acetyltransferase